MTRNHKRVTCHGACQKDKVNSMTIKAFHPLAEMLPLVQGAEFERLVTDIARARPVQRRRHLGPPERAMEGRTNGEPQWGKATQSRWADLPL